MSEPADYLRAGDADRDHTVGLLREAFAQGRLTIDEFRERLDAASTSRTYGELQALTADLPVMALIPVAQPDVAVVDPRLKRIQQAWAVWAMVSIGLVFIWILSIPDDESLDVPEFWPIWAIVPWALALLVATRRRPSD